MLGRLAWGCTITKDQGKHMGTQGKAKEVENRDVLAEHWLNGKNARDSRS